MADIYSKARECLAKANGNHSEACKLLRNELAKTEALKESFIQAGLSHLITNAAIAVARETRAQNRSDRRSGARTPTPPAKPEPAGLIVGYETLAVANLKSLLDFPVADGLKLADADRLLLTKRAAELAATASQFKVLSGWCGRIAGLLTPGQKVKDRLDDQQLRTLYQDSVEAERREKRIVSDPMPARPAMNGNGHATLPPSTIAPPSKAQLMGAR